MSDIVEFIRERLAEDEQWALAAGGRSWRIDPGFNERRVEGDDITIYDEGGHDEHQAAHIARHDPARVLREVAAKRRVLARHHEESHVSGPICRGCGFTGDLDEPRNFIHECEELQDLAAAWSDHPSYRSEWSPQ